LLVAVFAVLVQPARAQTPGTWQFQSGAVLSPNPTISFMNQSIGSPSVVFDTVHNRWFMLFESKTTTVDPNCPDGVWALGAAVSTDGIHWGAFTKPILLPKQTANTYYNCVASQPTATFSPTAFAGAGGLNVYFKAEQKSNACATTTPSWGCALSPGIGRLQITLDAATGNVKTVAVQTKPVYQPTTNPFTSAAVTTWGYPKLIQDKAKFRIAFQEYPDIVSVSGTNPALFTTVNGELKKKGSLLPGAVDEIMNPSMVCADDPTLKYAMFPGGRDTNGSAVVSGDWTKVYQATWAQAWFLDTVAQNAWTGNTFWRHWDVTKLNTGNYLVWFDEKDASGNNFIRLGGTTLSFTSNTAVSKACP